MVVLRSLSLWVRRWALWYTVADHMQCENNHMSFWTTSNRHTRVTIRCSSRQQTTNMHSDYLRVSQPRARVDNKQQTHTSHGHVFFWATSNHHAQWLHTSIITTCPSGQQATDTHVSQSRVLLGNKQPPFTVITYEYHNHVSFRTSKRQHVSQSRVLLGNKHPENRAIIHSVINMCPGRAPGKNVTDNLQSQTSVHAEQQTAGMHASK